MKKKEEDTRVDTTGAWSDSPTAAANESPQSKAGAVAFLERYARGLRIGVANRSGLSMNATLRKRNAKDARLAAMIEVVVETPVMKMDLLYAVASMLDREALAITERAMQAREIASRDVSMERKARYRRIARDLRVIIEQEMKARIRLNR